MKLSKQEFERKYKSQDLAELAKELGVTKQTVLNYVKKLGIELKGKGNRRAGINAKKKLIIE